jgi:pantoate--beta-alanine ligase
MVDQEPSEDATELQVATSTFDLRRAVAGARSAAKTIGLVPTMGALHEGHLSLVRASKTECDFTIVTIFVNPAQFGANEDLDKYPRTLEKDLDALRQLKVDLVFAPDDQCMYPAGFSTYVQEPDIAKSLEGQCRPGHFRGVTTVVLKLFNLAQADMAYFGQKDYQQACVIQRMVEDLNVSTVVRVCPIVRESDGLAMSSRNRYLDSGQRKRSLAVYRSLTTARDLVAEGQTDAPMIMGQMERVLRDGGVTKIDYAILAEPDTLQPVQQVNRPTMALVAAYIGQTRLIDNLRIEP